LKYGELFNNFAEEIMAYEPDSYDEEDKEALSCPFILASMWSKCDLIGQFHKSCQLMDEESESTTKALESNATTTLRWVT
jgi:hypothetical protein